MHPKETFRFITTKCDIAMDLITEHGWKKFFGEIAPWLFCRHYIFFSGPINGPHSFLQAKIPFRLELAEQRDLLYLIKLRPSFYDLGQIQKRVKQGHLCFLGWSGGEPIHIRWAFIRSRFLPYLHRTICLTPEEVYTDEAYTAPGFRYKGVYSYAGYLMRRTLKKMGYRKLILALPTWDTFMLSTAKNFRMKKMGEGGYWSLFGFKKFFWTGMIREQGNDKIFTA